MSRHLLIIAAEVSGDMHAAGMLAELKKLDPGISCSGIGGDRLRELGMEILYDQKDMATVGFSDVFSRFAFFRRVFREMVTHAEERRPDAVVLVDYPGFNLRFAKEAREMGLKVIYYICPQVWAWKQSRIQNMIETVDRLMTILPFEPEYFKGTKLKTDYVGNPLVDTTAAVISEPGPALPWSGASRVALLPGSRTQEITRILPPLIGAAGIISKTRPSAEFIIATPSNETRELAQRILDSASLKPAKCSVIAGQTLRIVRDARAAVVASGTATLETALLGCPMVIVYKTTALTNLIARQVLLVPNIGLVNVVGGRRICPELIQSSATPEAIAAELEPLLSDSPEREAMLEAFRDIGVRLGRGGSYRRAANIVMSELP